MLLWKYLDLAMLSQVVGVTNGIATVTNEIAGKLFRVSFYHYGSSTRLFWVSVSAAEQRTLGNLKPAECPYIPQCLTGTRKEKLAMIDDWASDINAPNILWLSGSPGAGKSAIASTVASTLRERKRLGSRFFFKSGDETLGNPASLWRTVAFDLARFDSAIKKFIIAALKEDKVDLEGGSVELHFKYLINQPLSMRWTNVDPMDPQNENSFCVPLKIGLVFPLPLNFLSLAGMSMISVNRFRISANILVFRLES